MYLTRSPSILCQILNKALNYSLKKKDEKQFIFVRLQLLDQQYCLDMDQKLWQSYLDIGLQQHLWPVSLFFNFILKSFFMLSSEFTLRMNFIRWQKQMISIYVNNM
jgi:hypothetical protein